MNYHKEYLLLLLLAILPARRPARAAAFSNVAGSEPARLPQQTPPQQLVRTSSGQYQQAGSSGLISQNNTSRQSKGNIFQSQYKPQTHPSHLEQVAFQKAKTYLYRPGQLVDARVTCVWTRGSGHVSNRMGQGTRYYVMMN